MYSENEAMQIVNTTYRQLQKLNWNDGLPFQFKNSMLDNVNFDYSKPTLQVVVKKTSRYVYKFFVQYNTDDTYSTMFVKIDKNDFSVVATEWSHGLYAENLLISLQCDYRDRDKLDYADFYE